MGPHKTMALIVHKLVAFFYNFGAKKHLNSLFLNAETTYEPKTTQLSFKVLLFLCMNKF